MATIFDGKGYSLKKKELLKFNVERLKEKGIIPHLATIIVGQDKASLLYLNLKKKFIEDIGCQLDIYKLKEKVKLSEIKILINSLNTDPTVHGIMIQFPLPIGLKQEKRKLIDMINPDKDVDGLRDDSKYLHPTSKAVLEILALAIFETKKEVASVCVIGANGMVGKPLVKELKKLNYKVEDVNTDTKNMLEKTLSCDVVVSATGVINLITPEMVKDDSIVIDVGSPFGDVSLEVEEKVSFITPVPGGVGPVTITCLAENLIIASDKI